MEAAVALVGNVFRADGQLGGLPVVAAGEAA
jgi:hypothetical protein